MNRLFSILIAVSLVALNCNSYKVLPSHRSPIFQGVHKFHDGTNDLILKAPNPQQCGQKWYNRRSQVTLNAATQPVPPPFTVAPFGGGDGAQGNRLQAQLTLLTVSALYGTNFGCVKILGDAMDPSVAAFLRFSLAAMVFSPYVLKLSKDRENWPTILGGIEVGVYAALGYYGQSQSLLTTSASTAAFICSLAVIVVPILSMIFKDKSEVNVDKKSSKPWYEPLLPALLATVGVGCLELGGAELPGVGDLWAFTQPLFFGLAFWRVEKHMQNKQLKSVEGSAQAFTGAMMAAVAIFSLFWSAHDFVGPILQNAIASGSSWSSGLMLAVREQSAVISSDWHILAAIVWTGIFTTALTSYGENVAMKDLSAAESTIIYSTEPLWGTAFASLVLGESVGWNTLVGAILILGACLWSSLGPTLSIAGSVGTLQSALGEGFAEISNNFNLNLMELADINDRVGP